MSQTLKRTLRLPDLLTYGLVFVVPIGPVSLFGIVFNASHGMVPLVYLIAMGAMLFTALSYMMMSREFPSAGSVYTYASNSIGARVGFISGWVILLDYFLIPALSYIGCAIAVHAAFPRVSKPLFIIGMLSVVTIVNLQGIRATARVSFVLLAFQIIILGVFSALAVKGIMSHLEGAHLSISPMYDENRWTPGAMFAALSPAIFSFLGFDAISTLSEESVDGAKGIGRATILTLCLSGVLFIAQTWLASLFVAQRMAFPEGDPTEAAFYDIAELIGGYWFKFVLTVPGVVLAGLASAVAAQAAAGRIVFGMARDGVLPRGLARVDSRRGVPVRAVLTVAMPTLVVGISLVEHLEVLVSIACFGILFGFLVLHLSVAIHFLPDRGRRSWGRHLAVPCIGFVIIALVMVHSPTNAKVAGCVWIIVGIVVYKVLGMMNRTTKALISEEQRV